VTQGQEELNVSGAVRFNRDFELATVTLCRDPVSRQ
jgi:hypothetical protein